MKPITNKAEYDAIMVRVEELLKIVDDNTPKTDKNYIELNFLTDLVIEYEKSHFTIGKSALTSSFLAKAHR